MDNVKNCIDYFVVKLEVSIEALINNIEALKKDLVYVRDPRDKEQMVSELESFENELANLFDEQRNIMVINDFYHNMIEIYTSKEMKVIDLFKVNSGASVNLLNIDNKRIKMAINTKFNRYGGLTELAQPFIALHESELNKIVLRFEYFKATNHYNITVIDKGDES